mgnify:CR=1 FL=1
MRSRLQAGRDHLSDSFGPHDVLKPMRTEVAERQPVGKVVLEHVNPTLVPREAPKRERREKSA